MGEYETVFKDVYLYMKKHYRQPRNYDELITEGEALAERYKDTEQYKFITGLLVAVWGALEKPS